MQIKRKIFSTILLSLLGIICLKSQEAIPTAGGDASSSNGSVSYTIGQVFYTSFSSTDGTLGQGVQQSYEIQVIDAINETSGIQLVCEAYPNPVNDLLRLRIDNYQFKELFVRIYDIQGNILENIEVFGTETVFQMDKYTQGVLFLKVYAKDKEIKTFKIIKH